MPRASLGIDRVDGHAVGRGEQLAEIGVGDEDGRTCLGVRGGWGGSGGRAVRLGGSDRWSAAARLPRRVPAGRRPASPRRRRRWVRRRVRSGSPAGWWWLVGHRCHICPPSIRLSVSTVWTEAVWVRLVAAACSSRLAGERVERLGGGPVDEACLVEIAVGLQPLHGIDGLRSVDPVDRDLRSGRPVAARSAVLSCRRSPARPLRPAAHRSGSRHRRADASRRSARRTPPSCTPPSPRPAASPR